MKIKTSELTGAALDWAVWVCAGGAAAYPNTAHGLAFLKLWRSNSAKYIHPSTDWSQGGPIIEREGITLSWAHPRIMTGRKQAVAQYFEAPHSALDVHRQFGDTPLIAAMRCYAASEFGAEVDVPEELL